jgi:hypothetical protein
MAKIKIKTVVKETEAEYRVWIRDVDGTVDFIEAESEEEAIEMYRDSLRDLEGAEYAESVDLAAELYPDVEAGWILI